MKNLEKRKKDLLKKLESMKREKISETELFFYGRGGNLIPINTNLNKVEQGIVSGEFITTCCWERSLNICVGMGHGSGEFIKQTVLWFLVEGINGITYYNVYEIGCSNFKELEEGLEAVFV